MTTKPIDYAVREAALDISESFAVSAPAGSGKTGLLTLRVLNLLAYSDKPEEILCITFTRKAAQEMRERILGALTEAQQLSHYDIDRLADPHKRQLMQLAKKAADNNQQRNWQLEKMPFRLKVLTIDGFCRTLTQQMPLMSKMGANPAISEDATAAFSAAVRSLLEDCHSHGWPKALHTLFNHLGGDLDRLASLLVSLLYTRDQWLPLIYQSSNPTNEQAIRNLLETNLQRWACDILRELEEELAPYESDLCELLDFAGTNMQETDASSAITVLAGVTCFPDAHNTQHALTTFWQPFAKSALASSTQTFLKRVDKRHGFPTGDKLQKAEFTAKKKRYVALLNELATQPSILDNLVLISSFPSLEYSQKQWAVLSALMALLPLLVAHLKLIFQQSGAVDFVEVSESARTALGGFTNVTDLSLKLDYQLKHILIDEFQDTSHSQLSLLQLLTREWDSDPDKTLFVVGDGMQSCYGFRNANVGIFLDVRQNGLAGKPCASVDLSVNFRSTDTIIQWVNEHFQAAFPQEDNITLGAVRYTPSSGFNSNTEMAAEKTTNADTSYVRAVGFIDQENRLTEAHYIATEIEALYSRFPNDSIAILVRGRSHLNAILPALSQRNIAYSAVDIDPLVSRQHIQDLLALTLLLEDPSSPIHWLTLLRSPWCGLNNIDLLSLYRPINIDEKHSSIVYRIELALKNNTLSSDGLACLERLANGVLHASNQYQRRSCRELVEACWLRLGGPETLENETHQHDANAFFSLLSRHSSHGGIDDPKQFVRALQKLYAQPDMTENAVQILTMHKSKGLEYDTVFLPSLDKQSRGDSAELFYWHERLNTEHNIDLLLSPISSSDADKKDPLTALLGSESKRRKTLEECRLLYVACTRAKHRLVLTANLSSDDKSEETDAVKPPIKSSMLAKLWPTLQSTLVMEINSGTATQPVPEGSAHAPQNQQIPRLPLTPPSEILQFETHHNWLPESYDNTELSVFDGAYDTHLHAAATGTVLHRILCQLQKDGLVEWDQDRISQAKPFWAAQLSQLGVHSNIIPPALNLLADTVRTVLQDPKGVWVLSNEHHASESEYQLHYGQPPKLAIVDRTFIDKEGTRWIIDYKSTVPKENIELEAFYAAEIARYKTQLAFYTGLLRQLDKNTQRKEVKQYKAALYFPRLCELVEVSLP